MKAKLTIGLCIIIAGIAVFCLYFNDNKIAAENYTMNSRPAASLQLRDAPAESAERQETANAANPGPAPPRESIVIIKEKEPEGPGTIAGIVVDEQGVGLPNLSVRLSAGDGDTKKSTATKTGDDGTFRFENCPQENYNLMIREEESRLPIVGSITKSVKPGEDHLKIIFDDSRRSTCWIKGNISDPNGQPLGQGKISISMGPNNTMVQRVDEMLGTFNIGPLRPGNITLKATHSRFAPSAPIVHKLQPRETWDAGEIMLDQGGNVKVTTANLEALLVIKILHLAADGLPDTTYSYSTEEREWMSPPLPPGNYIFTYVGGRTHGAMQSESFVITKNKTTELHIRINEGILQKIEILDKPGAPKEMKSLRVLLYSAAGTVIYDRWLLMAISETYSLPLVPGNYRFEVRAEDDRLLLTKTIALENAKEAPPIVLQIE